MTQPIKNFIQDEQSPLANILKKVDWLKSLNEKIVRHLRPELIPHCYIASFHQGMLRMVVDSAALATQLRYDIPGLLEQFSEDKSLPEILAMDCYVDAGWRLPFTPPRAIINKSLPESPVGETP